MYALCVDTRGRSTCGSTCTCNVRLFSSSPQHFISEKQKYESLAKRPSEDGYMAKTSGAMPFGRIAAQRTGTKLQGPKVVLVLLKASSLPRPGVAAAPSLLQIPHANKICHGHSRTYLERARWHSGESPSRHENIASTPPAWAARLAAWPARSTMPSPHGWPLGRHPPQSRA